MTSTKGRFTDENGLIWTRRLKTATKKQKKALTNAERLRKLYVATHDQRRKWGVSFPIARTLIDGLVCDSYVRNPDPMLEFLDGGGDPDQEAMIRGLLKTLHEEVKTEQIIQRGMVVGAFANFAIHWLDFDQKHENELIPVEDASDLTDDDPAYETTTSGKPKYRKRVYQQRFCGDLVMPGDFRKDPDGRGWDFKDSKWIARMYTRSLGEILDDESGAYTDRGKRLLRQWMEGRNRPQRDDSINRTGDGWDADAEKDDFFRMVNIWEIWSRVGYRIMHQPVGADFQIGAYDWPKSWRDADEYPATMIAFESDWQPPDEQGEDSWYPLAALQLVQSPLENLPRLEAAFLDSLTNAAKKYVGIDGLFDKKALDALQTDENRAYLPIDVTTLAKKIAGGGQLDLTQFDIRRFVMLLQQEGAAVEAANHLSGIQHQLELAYTLLGIGPGDRAGVPETNSATESMGIQERLADRRQKRIEEAATIADRISQKIWIVLRGQATLPIRYRYVTGMDAQTWGVITDPTRELLGMEVIFRHHVGSSRPPNREAIKAERKELFGLVAPVLSATGDTEEMKEWLWWLANAFDVEFASRRLNTGLKDLAKEIVLWMEQLRTGQRPIDRSTGNQFLSLVAKFFQGYLSPSQLQQVAQKAVQQVAPSVAIAAPAGVGSSAKSPSTAGQIASAEAAAGAVGGGM